MGRSDTLLKTLIIGSGPAGLAAALYAARANLDPVILSGTELGGQVSLTYSIENYPGFPDGIGGQELVEAFQIQAEMFGARIVFDSAVKVDLIRRPFLIETYKEKYLTKTLIIATGATPNHLEVPGETAYTGKGVSYCATCDGHFFKGKKVVIVGGGDSALEEGLFLTRYVDKISIIHRRDKLRASILLQKRAFANKKIDFIWDTIVTEIKGDNVVKSICLRNNKTGKLQEFETDGVFIFIGHHPNTELFKEQIERDNLGYIIVDRFMRTNISGVYSAGEVADPHYRQVITSAGMGASAAMQAIHYLEENPD